ncbi:MAG TPA: hypothetical protein VNL35_08175 [Chloroflexota bacterium]|nr:hypothetical protein [Chloroflexota bacterium]
MAGRIDYRDFEEHVIGVDTRDGRFGEVSIHTCRWCGQRWLHYLYEHEGFTASGRWWHGPISIEEAGLVTADAALDVLAVLPFYYVGGSYYGGDVTRGHGPIGPILST